MVISERHTYRHKFKLISVVSVIRMALRSSNHSCCSISPSQIRLREFFKMRIIPPERHEYVASFVNFVQTLLLYIAFG